MQRTAFPSEESVAARVKSCAVEREQAGRYWQDGLLIGNGDMAALAYADEHLEWIINKTDLFDPSFDDVEYVTHSEFLKEVEKMEVKNSFFLGKEKEHVSDDIMKHTISATRLRVRLWEADGWSSPAIPAYHQNLSLYDGELTEKVDAPYLQVDLTSFISRKDSVLCLRVKKQPKYYHGITLELNRPDDERLDDPSWSTEDGILAFTQPLPGGKGFYVVAMASPGEDATLRTWKRSGRLVLSAENDAFLAVRTSRSCEDPLKVARDAVRQAMAEGFDELQAKNRQWWHEFWKASYADFGNAADVTRQWFFCMYTLGATFGKAPMPGLNGLTYGPCNSMTAGLGYQAYTHDQNVQIAVMPLGMCNHPELISVLADTYLDIMPALKKLTREHFGVDGIGLPLAMNQDGHEFPTGAYRYTICGSAYSGLVLALTWKYCRDRVLLKEKIYPLLKEFIKFHLGLMHKDAEGTYHMDWSIPPEIFTLTRDDTATLSMLRTCIEIAMEATEVLDVDQDFCAQLREVLEHYPQLAKRTSGAWWSGPDIPLDHYGFGGHLMYPFFPSEAYTEEDAIRKTLDSLMEFSVEISQMTPEPHPMTEWSAFLTTATRLRLQMREESWRGIMDFLKVFCKPNGLFSHNPVWIMDTKTSQQAHENSKTYHMRLADGKNFLDFNGWSEDVTPNPEAIRRTPPVLEGSSAFLFMASETLLQSWGGIVKLFPTVPEKFSGSFLLRAQGGFLVFATMKDGVVTDACVQACEDGTLHLLCCDGSKREFIVNMSAGETWELPGN